MKTNFKVFNEQQTKLKQIQFVQCSCQLDSSTWDDTMPGSRLAIVVPIAAIAIVVAVVIFILLVITNFDWWRRYLNCEAS